jgi:hypothetical protein
MKDFAINTHLDVIQAISKKQEESVAVIEEKK